MKRLLVENSFKKDVKKLRKRNIPLQPLHTCISRLRDLQPLPPTARPHKLRGEHEGNWECHIANDWLLVYETTNETLTLHRTGSHADLFE